MALQRIKKIFPCRNPANLVVLVRMKHILRSSYPWLVLQKTKFAKKWISRIVRIRRVLLQNTYDDVIRIASNRVSRQIDIAYKIIETHIHD